MWIKIYILCEELKLKLIEIFEEKLPELKCGYLEKGSKRWVEDDNNLEAMYETFDSTEEEQLRKTDAGKKRKLEDAKSNDITKINELQEKKA